jgi:hypothetical protein
MPLSVRAEPRTGEGFTGIADAKTKTPEDEIFWSFLFLRFVITP